jgi:hypothetical protein
MLDTSLHVHVCDEEIHVNDQSLQPEALVRDCRYDVIDISAFRHTLTPDTQLTIQRFLYFSVRQVVSIWKWRHNDDAFVWRGTPPTPGSEKRASQARRSSSGAKRGQDRGSYLGLSADDVLPGSLSAACRVSGRKVELKLRRRS